MMHMADPTLIIRRLAFFKKLRESAVTAYAGQFVHRVFPGCNVYLMTCSESIGTVRYIKVGVANDVVKRVSAVRTANPLHVKRAIYFCFNSVPEAFKVEKQLHELLADHHHSGEWFRFDDVDGCAAAVNACSDYVADLQGDEFAQFIYDATIDMDRPDVRATGELCRSIWRDVEEKFYALE